MNTRRRSWPIFFYRYGELRQGRALARQILRKRPIATTGELMAALEGFAAPGRENKFFAQVFQALRIAVNDELGALEDFLTQSGEVLREGGRLSVISYHSLEDRLVKNFIRSGRFSGEVEKDFYGNPLRPCSRWSAKRSSLRRGKWRKTPAPAAPGCAWGKR